MNRLPVHCHNEAQKGIKEWCLRSFLNPLSSAERRHWADYSNPYLIWGTYQSFVASNAALLTCRRRDHFLRVSSSSSVVDGGVRGLSVYGTRSSQQGKGKDVLCCVEKGWLMLFVGFSDFVVGLFGPHFLSTQDEFPDCVCLSGVSVTGFKLSRSRF